MTDVGSDLADLTQRAIQTTAALLDAIRLLGDLPASQQDAAYQHAAHTVRSVSVVVQALRRDLDALERCDSAAGTHEL